MGGASRRSRSASTSARPPTALQIEIRNSGALENAPRPRQRRPGIGLENVRRRLALHYPGRHRFVLDERSDDGGTVVAALVLEGEPCSGS
jgi:LytS/YehU family sensor histidine kinase